VAARITGTSDRSRTAVEMIGSDNRLLEREDEQRAFIGQKILSDT
jgi:hypothetical protein